MSSDFREKLFCIYPCSPLALVDLYAILVYVGDVNLVSQRVLKMQIEVVVVTVKKVVRTLNVADIKEAKSVALGIDKATLVGIRCWDGDHFVQIEKFPMLGKPDWEACNLGSEVNIQKNKKLLERFKKSSYAT